MIKRLSVSLLLMGLAVFALGAAAFAWFSDSGQAAVTVTAGTADLKFRIDIDCDGGSMDGYDTAFFDATTPYPFNWSGVVPGDTTTDCIEVMNSGDGEMTVHVLNGPFSGNNSLRNATLWQYNAIGTGGINCPYSTPQAAQYTSGRGCELDTIDEGESFVLQVMVEFVDNGANQNLLQGQSFGFTSTLTGYTG